MILQITYELKDSDRNYSSLFSEIENLGPSIHFLRDSWWVEVEDGSLLDDILPLLRGHINQSDLIHVVDITDQKTNGWLARTSWNWLKERGK